MPNDTRSFRPKSRAEQRIEHEHGVPLPQLLHRMYHEEGLSQPTIARMLGVRVGTVSAWMRDNGIPTRDRRALARAVA